MSAEEDNLAAGELDLPEDFDESQFEDPDDFEDEISDEELLGDVLKDKPRLDLSTDPIIVVDNVPKVNQDRLPKLENVLNKVFSKFGTIVSHFHPKDEKGTTKGYFFLEFANCEQAEQAVKAGNGYRLDKAHIFVVNHFSDFDKYENVPEDWEPPEKEEYREVGDLKSWLLEPNGNDQFAVMYAGGAKEAIAYNTSKGPKLVMEREGWSDTYLRWSPRGSYLATFHVPKGVAVWGTKEFKRIQRFLHPGAQMVDFSPCENYIMSLSRSQTNPDDPDGVIVWDTRTGAKKRGFSAADVTDWPVLKWSHDGRYFARRSKDLLSVYETPSFGLLDKRSLVFKGISDYQWSPTDHFVAYWVPEQGANPAKVALIQLPSRMEIRSKNLFQVSECHLRWQKAGDYLVVRVDRWATKSKKQLTYSLEVFHIRKPDIPVDTIEIKEPVLTFAVEPHGDKLAVLYGIAPRIKLNLYGIKIIKGATPDLLQSVNTRLMNHLSWSPRGQCLVLAALKSSQTAEGYLEFYDTGEANSPTCQLMNSQEHADMTDLEWDPTGRFITTSVSFWSNKRDTGFQMWSFQGKALYKQPLAMERFCQFLWRPRPPSLLTDEDMQHLKKNLKKYYQQFDAQDRISLQTASQELIEKRTKLMKEFNDFKTKIQQAFKKKCKEFPQYIMEEEEEEVSEEEISVLVSIDESIVPED